jgi:GAF domain-containing protein
VTLDIHWSRRHGTRSHHLTAVAEPLIIVPQHVVLLTRDASLVVAVRALLDVGDTVTELESPHELPSMGQLPVDAVVVDLPKSMRGDVVERVRGRFSGPLVVLLGHGEDAMAARGVYSCAVLSRPFGMSQLWSLLVESKTEVMPAIGRDQAYADNALAGGPAAPPEADATPPTPPEALPGRPPGGRPGPGRAGRRGPEVLPERLRERVRAFDEQDLESGGDTPAAAPAGAPAGAPGVNPQNLPAWNWRFRRFQTGPTHDDDADRTEQLPAVTRPGNGLPQPVGPPSAPGPDPGVGRAVEPGAAGPEAAHRADTESRVLPQRDHTADMPEMGQAAPLPDPPEAVAARIAERLRADAVALLLDNNRGLLEVAGGVGLTPAERQTQVEYGHEVLTELFRVGVGLIEDTDRVRGLIHGLPCSHCQTLVMVPLVHEGHGFGALVIGRSDHPGEPRAEFTEPEIEALMDFAEDVAAPLRSTVLLRRLKGQLGSNDKG